MASSSIYNSATGTQSPHCIHAIGIGRTGAAYIEALLRTGEIEDLLAEDPRATCAVLAVDIGDQDMAVAVDYASSFKQRLKSRGVSSERFNFQAIALPVPGKEEFFEGLNRTREFLKLEYPRYYWNPNLSPTSRTNTPCRPPAATFRASWRRPSTPTHITPASARWTRPCAASSTPWNRRRCRQWCSWRSASPAAQAVAWSSTWRATYQT